MNLLKKLGFMQYHLNSLVKDEKNILVHVKEGFGTIGEYTERKLQESYIQVLKKLEGIFGVIVKR